MRARVSRISLIVFVVMLILSTALASLPGGYWPWYAIMAIFAVPPIVIGTKRQRFLGVLALGLLAVLIASDIQSGKVFRKHMREQRERFEQAQHMTNAP